jgi:hypothetical protein
MFARIAPKKPTSGEEYTCPANIKEHSLLAGFMLTILWL